MDGVAFQHLDDGPFEQTEARPCTNVTRAAVEDKQQAVGPGTVRMPSRNGGEIGEEIDRLLTNHHLQLQFQQHRTVLTKGEQSQLQ